jgi:acyl dehydratase
MRVFESLTDVGACVGQLVGTSGWLAVSQERIDRFAQATDDHQWIHVDPMRARTGPFGATIAHGFLTLSLLPHFFETTVQIRGVRMALNYGLNRVRFVAPVPVDSRLRAHLTLLGCEPVDAAGVQLLWEVSVEREGASKPVCVAELLTRQYP